MTRPRGVTRRTMWHRRDSAASGSLVHSGLTGGPNMLIRRGTGFTSSEITDHRLYLDRRAFMAGAAALVLAPSGAGAAAPPAGQALQAQRNAGLSPSAPPP